MCSDFMDCRRCSPTVMVYTYLRIMTLLTDVIMSVETKPRCIFHQGCLKLVIFVNVFIRGRMKQVRACRSTSQCTIRPSFLFEGRMKGRKNKIKVCE